MNTHQWYMMGLRSIQTPNTFIGGVSATISTAALLASKLGILESRITNFSVIGSDIQCRITGSYSIPIGAFNFNGAMCTYYRDIDYLVTSLGSDSFYYTNISGVIDFRNLITANNAFKGTPFLTEILLKNATSVGDNCFSESTNGIRTLKTCYIPNVTTLGTTSGDNGVFAGNCVGLKVYAHPSLATNNGGAPDSDLAYVIANGGTVVYVTNFTVPNPITTLAVGNVYATAVQLNFTPPSSTNAIDYYEVYIDGIYNQTITASGQYIIGLTASTAYSITVIAVDIFYNKSTVSNTLTQSTDNYSYTDTDANASISAKSLTGSEQESEYLLITGLKSNNLYAKCQVIYTFKGAAAAQQKFNSKNPIDTDGAFRLTFNGTASFSNLGYQLNGSSYANTHFVPSVQQLLNSNGITVVCGTNNVAFSSNVVEVGAYNGATQASYLMVKNNNTNYKRRTALNSETVECSQSGTNEAKGIFTGTKQSSTVTDLFVNGSQVATSNQSAGTLPTLNIYIGALNFANSGVTHSNQRLQIVILHEGLSDAEVATLHSIIDLSETIAGRKTW